jgi:4-aminobutyrate aminotransferase-like enzyme
MNRSHEWDLATAEWIVPHTVGFSPDRARRLAEVQLQFLADVKRVQGRLPVGVIYNDANRGNVTVRATAAGDEVAGVFDFGDVTHTARVFEVAIAAAYAILGRSNVLEVVREVVRGYHDVCPLTEPELAVVFPALAMRLAVSVTGSERAAKADPDNAYIRVDQTAAWDALARMEAISPVEASDALRAACGFHVASDEASGPASSLDDVVRRRRAVLGRSLSLSYDEPLDIVSGRMQYLFDKSGRSYLDGVNNVCHVGHCHPRVVEAATRQIAELNTNTRYLHDHIVRYAERLAATLPEPLNVCFFVNSGTEANELALRMARTFTNRRRVLAIDHAYHGHSVAMIDISSYKHDGPGGAGKPDWLHRVPCPDSYRGRYTAAEFGAETGARYAEHVTHEIEAGAAAGDEIAALFAEPILGCGGQIVPPPGYLADAFARARAGGTVCVADEVQIGFGRVGDHMWSSVAQGAVPDIVTMGKPIGNGHPMAAVVTTREIADAFANGMEFFSTFGGNPVSAAVGLAVLDAIETDDLMRNAREVGGFLLERFRSMATRHPAIGDVRGTGLYLGVELVTNRETKTPNRALLSTAIQRARAQGVLLSADGPDRNVLKIKPPMCISKADAELLLIVFERALAANES